MTKVRFNLQTANNGEGYIRLVYRYGKQKLVWPTGHKIPASCWNTEANRMRRTATCTNANSVNHWLDILAAKAEAIYLDYRNEGRELSPARFREELRAFTENRTLKSSDLQLFEFFEQLMEERKKSPDYTAGTIEVYGTTLLKLREYVKETRRKVDFDTVDLEFASKFAGWMNTKEHKPNYTNKVLGTLKTVMNVALERGLHSNRAHQFRNFNVRKEEPEHIYLNDSELEQIARVELSEGLDNARDLFLLGCYTGLRFSDYSELRTDNIVRVEDVELFSITQQKTRRRVSIPVLPGVRAILDKYGGAAPGAISNQKFNVYIKDACEIAKIKTPVSVVSFSDSMRVSRQVPKWSLVASHTARRSFATNEALRCLKSGKSIRPIMDILGHRVERTFWNYVKISPEQSALEFARGRAG